MFHSGNIPIIEEDDMKLVELVINSVVTSSIASDLMYGHIDGVKLKYLNQAHNNNFSDYHTRRICEYGGRGC